MPRFLINLAKCEHPFCKVQMHNLRPSIFGCRKVALAVQGNGDEGVSVDELNCPIQDADKAPQNTEEDSSQNIALSSLGTLGDGTYLAQEVDDSHN
jgi:hypothetical protein